MNRSTLWMTLATLAVSASAANATYLESRIRQSDQELKVNGRRGTPMQFSVTGFAGDVISSPFASGTVKQLMKSPLVYDVVYHADGLITLRFRVPSPQYAWNGQEVKLSHNGDWVDRDPIVIQ